MVRLLEQHYKLAIPREVWVLQAGGVLNAYGTGLAYPFLLLYLHHVRGFSVAVAGGIVGLIAATTLLVTPSVGMLIDRLGARPTLLGSLLVLALGYASFALVKVVWQAVCVAIVAGIGSAGFWPANITMITRMLQRGRAHVGFGLERTATNLGLGFGAATGGLIAATYGYPALFVFDGATFLIYLTLVLVWGKDGTTKESAAEGRRASTWGLLASQPLRRMLVLKALFILVGYGPFEVLATMARDQLGVSTRLIGLIFLANTMVIVCCQLPLTKAIEGRRRLLLLAGVAVLWALAWVTVALSLLAGPAVLAAVVLMVASALMGLGEVIQSPAQEPLVLALAPEDARGRVMSLSSLAFQASLAIGTTLCAFVLDHSPVALWIGAAVLALAIAVLGLRWEKSIPMDARRV
jgi:predicted MFS family arabinose efflux permease